MEGQFCIEEVVETLSRQLPFLRDINRKEPACLVSSLIRSFTMKIFHFNFLSLVLINELLSTMVTARLKCSTVNVENGIMKMRSKGRIGVYKCNSGFYLLGTQYAACIKGKWDSRPPVCLRPGCPTISSMLNGYIQSSYRSSLIKFICKPGFRLIGPEYIYCNGRKWSGMQSYCKAIDINCNFENENTCNWKVENYEDDDFNWRLQHHEPPSRILKTGPLHDHTLSPNNTGRYLVLETSDYTLSSRPARILSPIFPQPSDDNFCFIFWYHMYGNTVGTLNVFLNNNLIFQRKGNHGDRWIKGVISLHENVTSSQLQLIIEGSHGGGYTGDIGLDDFSIANGTDCFASQVTSCVGRCYEDHEDTSFCLCNPECFTDSSCCKDFVEVCSLESTTSFFEASTVAEESTKVETDSTGTTESELYTETYTSTSELETVDRSQHIYTTDSTNFISTDFYTTAFISNPAQFEKEGYNSTNSTRGLNHFSSLLVANHTNKFNIPGIHNYNMATKRETTNKDTSTAITLYLSTDYEIRTNLSNQSIKKPTLINKNSNHTDNSTALRAFFKYIIQSNNSYHSTPVLTHIIKKIQTESPFAPLKTTSTVKVDGKTLNLDLTTTTDKTTISYKTRDAEIVKTTVKVPITATQYIFKKNLFNKMLTVVSQGNNKSATLASRVHETNTMPSPTYKYVTENIQVPIIFTEAFIFESSLPPSSTKKVPLIAPASVSSFPSHKYISKNISTILPNFHNSTRKLFNHTNITFNKVNNNEMNGSHTHLQITSQLPLTFKQLLLVTLLETSTVHSKHYNISQVTKWKSIYKPKESFMFSAVQSDTSSGKETYIALLVCALVIGVISVTLVIFFLKRRQRRFINEVEDADTEILYHSSQEILNLHVAQSNLL